jgi:hypothetical protein
MTTLSSTLTQLADELSQHKSKECAWNIMNEYFSFFDKESIQNELWTMTVGTLTNDEMRRTEKGKDRLDLVFFFEYTKLFFDAAFFLYSLRRDKGNADHY